MSSDLNNISRKLTQRGTERRNVYICDNNNANTISTKAEYLPTKYQEFQDVFNKDKASRLPEHRPYDCPIDLQPGKDPPWGPIYSLSPIELKVLRDYIDENF